MSNFEELEQLDRDGDFGNRERQREFDELRQSVDDRFDALRSSTLTNIRWLGGLFIVVTLSASGAFITSRLTLEHVVVRQDTVIEHTGWQDKQLQEMEARLRQLEVRDQRRGGG